MDLFNKKKVATLEGKIAELEKQLENYKITKEESKYLDLKLESEKYNKLVSEKQIKVNELDSEIHLKQDELEKLNIEIQLKQEILNVSHELEKLNNKIEEKKKFLKYIDEDNEYQEFGLYKPKYNLMNSELYKERLEKIRNLQKEMIKNKTATSFSTNWTLDGSLAKGRAMTNDNVKMLLRSFNNECDACITKVKFNNIENIRKRIEKSYEVLNKLGKRTLISIRPSYLNLKLQELNLAYEYEVKKNEEKEEQARIKERMKEEAKALKEIEMAKAKIEKEETHFKNAISKLEKQLSSCSENEIQKLKNKIEELKESLQALEKDKIDIENREKNTRAGYVYIISNIGSFGENVYKIGMTRRLDPFDRVRELGSASVPFRFDVHAMIFSEDAPALENALHKKFASQSVNKINMRKEFFRVSLNDIEKEVKANFNEVVEFTKIAEASEYRQSLEIENSANKEAI